MNIQQSLICYFTLSSSVNLIQRDTKDSDHTPLDIEVLFAMTAIPKHNILFYRGLVLIYLFIKKIKSHHNSKSNSGFRT